MADQASLQGRRQMTRRTIDEAKRQGVPILRVSILAPELFEHEHELSNIPQNPITTTYALLWLRFLKEGNRFYRTSSFDGRRNSCLSRKTIEPFFIASEFRFRQKMRGNLVPRQLPPRPWSVIMRPSSGRGETSPTPNLHAPGLSLFCLAVYKTLCRHYN